ncbi:MULTISPECIES: hypothetical protein [Rhodococcus]|uniref:hypothetical protein n=1 Tax=Rhodococcus TaxID=1827 RepID=UPI000C9A4FC4|nr:MULTISPECIES: hypothetical protein [Rhodococcus]WKX01802.1 hypothetical protein Q3O43_27900 [Rhodococcus aetherivorans]
MDDFAQFARDVLAVLRPCLPVEVRDTVDFYCEDGRWHRAVVTAVRGAAQRRAALPALMLKLLQVRAEDGVSFRRRDAAHVLRALPHLRADALP